MDQLLTTEEAAAKLQVSPLTLARWRNAGEGPAFVGLGHKTVRYREADLEKYIEDNTNTAGGSNDV
jgi:excisionase family DNA binding protein